MKHIVACSLGKDSVAMLLMMIEKGMQIDDIRFANTTMEFPENWKYLKKLEEYIGRKINIIQPNTNFNKWFYGLYTRGNKKGMMRGMPYVLNHSWCCREFKVRPMERLKSKDDIVYLGIAYDEKHRIQKEKMYRYPLIDWKITENDCRRYLEQKGLLNPLYDKFNRIGCWCCPKQSLHSLKVLYTDYPKLWNQLKKYESDSPHGFRIGDNLNQLENRFKKENQQTKLQ
jgi:3'-phosphoadenosine 5'-phosphosulfate sulfotransferase (PAPS reductase)/FAD synthetase